MGMLLHRHFEDEQVIVTEKPVKAKKPKQRKKKPSKAKVPATPKIPDGWAETADEGNEAPLEQE